MKIANVLISDSWGDVTPEALNRGIGGREGALLYLSREWAKLGHEVSNFVNIEKASRFSESEGYHEYLPLDATKSFLTYLPYDAIVAWECPSMFNDEGMKSNPAVKICEMQVAHLSERETKAVEDHIDYLAVLSDWHGNLMLNTGMQFLKEDVVTLPNGVDINRYPIENFNKKLKKKITSEVKFVYSSSPDRGLWYLLQMWPTLRKEFPGAELLVCYGAEKWIQHIKWAHSRVGEMAVEIEHLLKQPGVTDLGKIGQDKLSQLQLEADAWLYPIDPIQSTETGCISAIENAAAGNPIITTDADCMEDEFSDVGVIIDLPFEPEVFAQKTIEVLTDQEYVEYLRETARVFAENRNWGVIAKQWLPIFSGQN